MTQAMIRAKPLNLSTLLEQHALLPSQPRAVALLSSELRQLEPGMRSLVQLFSTDPVLTARMLAVANGPVHQLAQRVHSIPEALVVLAPVQLRQLVQKSAPTGATHTQGGWSLAGFWRYSLDTARIARALAMSVQANASAAYTLGLLHGLGQLLLRTVDPETFVRLAELLEPMHPKRPEVETQLMGYCTGQITAHLARQWNFPLLMSDAFQYMNTPLEQPTFEPLTGVLHLAIWRASTRALNWNERQLAVSFPAEAGLALGMDIDMVLRQASINWYAANSLDVQF